MCGAPAGKFREYLRKGDQVVETGDKSNSKKPVGPEITGKDQELGQGHGLEKPAATRLSLLATQLGDLSALTTLKGKVQFKAAEVQSEVKQPSTPPPETAPAPTLDQQALLKKVVAIHDALNRKALWGIGWSSPDQDRIFRELDPLNQTDRSALEKLYAEKYGQKDNNFYALRRELKDRLGSEADAHALAILNRKDGRTNDAGQLNTLLTKLDSASGEQKENNSFSLLHVASDIVVPGKFLYERYKNHTLDGDRAAAEKQIRETVAGLNSKQLADMDRDYMSQYGKSFQKAILGDKNLSAETREALKIYLKNADPGQNGIDRRTAQDQLDLAAIALKNKDLDMLGEALRGDSPAAAEARKKFIVDQGDEKLKAAFSGADLTKARDFMMEGRIGLAEIAREDTAHWYHTNKSHLEQALADASDTERNDYTKGRELAMARKSPSSAEEKHQLDYYASLHATLKKAASNDRELTTFEDKLLRQGSLISDLTSSHSDGWWITGIGKGHDTGDLLSKIENMKEQDWKRLKTDPSFKNDINAALSSFASPDERKRAEDLLNRKASAETFEQAKSVERSILSTVSDSTHHGWFGSTSYDKGKILDAVVTLSPDDQKKFREDAQFAREVNDDINKSLPDGPEKNLANRLLAKVAAGKELKLDTIDKVLLDTAKGAKPDQTVRDIEAAFKQDGTLLRRMKNPQTDEDKNTRRVLEGALTAAVFKAGVEPQTAGKMYERYSTVLFESGGLPLSMKLELSSSKKDKYEDIVSAPEGVRKNILSPSTNADVNLHNKVFRNFSKEEQQVVENGLRQGSLSLADKVRAFTLDDGTSYQDLREPLQQLRSHPDQLEALKNEYTRKYNRSLDDDLLSRVDEKDRSTYRDLLTPASLDGRQDFYEALSDHVKSRSGLSDAIMAAGWWDGTRTDLDKALNENAAVRGEYARKFEDLPADRQEQLIGLYSRALTSYRDSKGQMTEQLVDGALVVGSLAAAPLSGGASLTGLVAIAGAGAAFKIGATAALQGNDFNNNPKELAKLALQGAFTTGLAMVGPAQVASLFKVGDAAAAEAVAGLGAKLGAGAFRGVEGAVLKEGYEVAGRQALATMTREALVSGRDLAAADFARVADGLVRTNLSGAARQQAVKQVTGLLAGQYNVALEQGERTLVRTILQSGRSLATEAVSNAAIGATASAASQVVSFPLDYDPRLGLSGNFDLLKQRMTEAGIAGAAGGALFTGIFHLARPLPGAVRSGFRRLSRSGAEGGESVGVTLGIKNGEQIIAPDAHNPSVEITHSNGETTTVRSGERYALKPGDEVTGLRPEGEGRIKAAPEDHAGAQDAIREPSERPAAGKQAEERLWNPQRNYDELTFEQREFIHDTVGPNPTDLIYNDPIDSFIEKSLSTTSGWKEDLSAAGKRVEVLRQKYEAAFEPYKNEVLDELAGRMSPNDMLERPQVEAVLNRLAKDGTISAADVQRKLAILDEVLAARTPYTDEFMRFNQLMDQRRTQLETMLNDFADSQGLPRVTLKTVDDMGAAEARYGDGLITLRTDALYNQGNTARLIESAYHEFVHHEQDNVIIRMVIDQVKKDAGTASTALSAAEKKQVQDLYKQLTNGTLSNDHLDAVFAARKGQVLSPSEIERAQRMAEAKMHNAPVGPQYVESGNHFAMTRRALHAYNGTDPNVSFKLAGRLGTDSGVASEHYFGLKIKSDSFDHLPAETQAQLRRVRELIDLQPKVYNEGADWPRQEADQLFKGMLSQRLSDINEFRRQAYDRYFAGVHEKEAWLVAERARLQALRRGATSGELPPATGVSAEAGGSGRYLEGWSGTGRGFMDSIRLVDDTGASIPVNGQARISELSSRTGEIHTYNREVVRASSAGSKGGDARQIEMFNIVQNQLQQLQDTGLVGRDWALYPTAIGSGADRVGADYLLVNSKTGEFRLLDPTSNPDKRNIALLRADGIIQFEPRIMDQIGALRTDPEEVPEIRQLVGQFKQDLSKQLVDLTSTPSLLNLHEAPFPSALPSSSPEAVQKEVERFVTWLKSKADDDFTLSTRDRSLFRDYATVLERGAQKHAQIVSARQPAPPELKQIVQKAADSTVLDVAVRQVLGKTREAPGVAKSDVIVNKQGNINFHVSNDLIYDAGSAEALLKESRARLFDVNQISRMIPKGKWNALHEAFPGQSDQKILERVRTAIQDSGRLIGTRTADNYYPFIDDLAARLRARTPEDLLRKPGDSPIVAAKPAVKLPVSEVPATPSAIDALPAKDLKDMWSFMMGDVLVSAENKADVVPIMEMLLDSSATRETWTAAQIEQFRHLMAAYERGDGQAVKMVGDTLK